MLPTANLSGAMLCLISTILCLLSGGILLLYSDKRKAGLYLGCSYFAFGYAFTIAGLTYSQLIHDMPHLYRTGNFAWLICMPLSWLYIRTVVTNKALSRWDLLHLLPLLLYLIDYFPFFISSAAHKAATFQADISGAGQMIRYHQGWLLPANAQLPIRAFQAMAYWVLQVALIASPRAAHLRKDRIWIRWMILYLSLQIPMFLPTLIVLVTGINAFLWASTVPPVTAALLSAITLLLHPNILYGSYLKHLLAPGKTKHIDNELVRRLTAQLDTLMREEKPFLNPGYSLGDLAATVGIQPHKLSAFINQSTGTNFSEYLNQWRIKYCLDLIHEKKIVNLNQNGIASKCGFTNRNTFSSAFKRVTGKTPSAYLHTMA